MSKMYGSMLCPDCVEAKEYFKKINYKYDFVNITESMVNLKEFLHLRDTRKEFEEVNEIEGIDNPVTWDEETKTLLLGEPLIINKDNVNDYDF